jgi:hypothetical protein
VQRQTRLVPVSFDEHGRRAIEVEDRLLRIIQDHATDAAEGVWTEHDRDDLRDRARLAIAGIADQIQAEARDRNEGWLVVRRATLERTLSGKIRKRRSLLARATEERIVRMRRAEIENLEAELARRLAELERRREVEAESSPIGMGRLRVIHASAPSLSSTKDASTPNTDLRSEEAIDGFPEPPRVFRT